MEDRIEIKQRKYTNFYNEITDTLKAYIKEPADISMINTGVTIDDYTLYSIVCIGYTIATFKIDKTNKIIGVTVNPIIFDQPYYNITSLFKASDRSIITSFLNSFVGLNIESYKGDGNNV